MVTIFQRNPRSQEKQKMKHRNSKLAVLVLFVFLIGGILPLSAQTVFNSREAGVFNAAAYNWSDRDQITTGNSATGSQTITLQWGSVSLLDGRELAPFATNAPITIGTGTTVETVTPTAVSNCNIGRFANNFQTCQITASFSNVHGAGEVVFSGTAGLQEAINDASLSSVKSPGQGGVVVVDKSWVIGGGTQAMLAAANYQLNATFEPVSVTTLDMRTGNVSYWYGAPGLTRIAAPTALTTAATATLTTSTTGGTIATATTPRFTITAVDQFGGETAAADDSAATATLVDGAGSTNSYGITAAGLPTGTGIVGYRLYVSASGGATQTETLVAPAQMIFTSAPLCPLVGCIAPATAVTLTALPATTAAGPPQGTAAAATSLASAHTTVVAKQSGVPPTMLPFNDTAAPGYWPVTVTSATTLAAGFDVMGELPYPAGFFNTLGSVYRVCGGGVVTPSAATVAGTWNIRIGPRENSAGTSGEHAIVPFGFVASNQWTAALSHFDFCTDITVSTTGTSGVLEGSGTNFCVVVAAGNDGAGTDTCVGAFNAASTATDLTVQGVVQVSYVQTAASWTLPQLRYLSIRRL
jgi:hypothetical protein